MIIFDLDGTLANCEHRRHFVDPEKNHDYILDCRPDGFPRYLHKKTGYKFKPDFQAFNEACDKDEPIMPVIFQCRHNFHSGNQVQIWSGRCESVREKTEEWLEKYSVYHAVLKMRPIGDNTPDDQLKERWLDEYIESMYPPLNSMEEGKTYYRKDPIEMVFDDRPKVIRMWRRRGIFVFDVNQTGAEF
jgi:hypothetical protein